jgi:hypothetical protein
MKSADNLFDKHRHRAMTRHLLSGMMRSVQLQYSTFDFAWPRSASPVSGLGARKLSQVLSVRPEIIRIAPDGNTDTVNTIGTRMCWLHFNNPHPQPRIPIQRGEKQFRCLGLQKTHTMAVRPSQPKWQARGQKRINTDFAFCGDLEINILTWHNTRSAYGQRQAVQARLMNKWLHTASLGLILVQVHIDHYIFKLKREAPTLNSTLRTEYFGCIRL